MLHQVITTEKVPFTYRVAGLGSRFGAPAVRAIYDVYYAKTRTAKEKPDNNIALKIR